MQGVLEVNARALYLSYIEKNLQIRAYKRNFAFGVVDKCCASYRWMTNYVLMSVRVNVCPPANPSIHSPICRFVKPSPI